MNNLFRRKTHGLLELQAYPIKGFESKEIASDS